MSANDIRKKKIAKKPRQLESHLEPFKQYKMREIIKAFLYMNIAELS